MFDDVWKFRLTLLAAVIILGSCYLSSFILISKYVGSTDNWNQIQDQTGSIWSLSMFGAVFMFAAAFFYFNMENNVQKIMYFIFTMTFIAMGLSFSSLGIALIHKN